MTTGRLKRLATGLLVTFAAGALAVPTATAYPTEPGDGRLVAPIPSMTSAVLAQVKKQGKAVKRVPPPRRKPPLEPTG